MSLGPLMVDVAGRSLLPEDRDVLMHPLVGGVILFSRNFESVAQLVALVRQIRALRNPALLVAVDHEGGRVQRFRSEFTRVPPMQRFGHEYDVDRARGRAWAKEAGWVIGAELRAVGIDLAFTPVVDLAYGLSEVIGDRAFHKDPLAVYELASSLVAGLGEAGMGATAKHFPGHGSVVADSHVALPIDRRALPDMDADVLPYRRLIANGLASIMMAHVVFPEVDELPASLSHRWVTDFLRIEMGFSGAIVTDDLSMAGAAAFGGVRHRAELALHAGNDLLLVCNSRASVHELLDHLVWEPRPASALRLARLRGRQVPSGVDAVTELRASARWQTASTLMAHALNDRPALSLKG